MKTSLTAKLLHDLLVVRVHEQSGHLPVHQEILKELALPTRWDAFGQFGHAQKEPFHLVGVGSGANGQRLRPTSQKVLTVRQRRLILEWAELDVDVTALREELRDFLSHR